MDNQSWAFEPATLAVVAAGRFLTLPDVAEILNISLSQTYALVRSRELIGIKIGGRGQWRVEQAQLDDYIARMYEQTRAFLASHPFVEGETEELPDEGEATDLPDPLSPAHPGERRPSPRSAP